MVWRGRGEWRNVEENWRFKDWRLGNERIDKYGVREK
jgi:hypothetical protein